MAFIEIDCTPATHSSIPKWSIKINRREKNGLPDIDERNLNSFTEALVILYKCMGKSSERR